MSTLTALYNARGGRELRSDVDRERGIPSRLLLKCVHRARVIEAAGQERDVLGVPRGDFYN